MLASLVQAPTAEASAWIGTLYRLSCNESQTVIARWTASTPWLCRVICPRHSLCRKPSLGFSARPNTSQNSASSPSSPEAPSSQFLSSSPFLSMPSSIPPKPSVYFLRSAASSQRLSAQCLFPSRSHFQPPPASALTRFSSSSLHSENFAPNASVIRVQFHLPVHFVC